jgi:hypothetical protein
MTAHWTVKAVLTLLAGAHGAARAGGVTGSREG